MNFVKRAAFSLLASRVRTALLLGIFLVICTLLLGGSLLQGVAARQEAAARREIGVDVTVRSDRLTTADAVEVGSSPLVDRYNPVLRGVTAPRGLVPVTSGAPEPAAAKDGPNGLALTGIRDFGLLLDFATGRSTIVSGRGVTAKDSGQEVVMLEQRLAEKNRLNVGDTVSLVSADGKHRASFTVVGLYRSPAPTPAQWTAPQDIAANQVYAPVAPVSALGFGDSLSEAVFRIGSPGTARSLRADAVRLLGTDGFRFDVNDRAYRDRVEPLQRVGALAGALVRLISLGGATVLGLIVMLTVRGRRAELGVLLALGEKKWKIVGQHAVEVMAVAVAALAVTALLGLFFARPAGEELLDREHPQVRMEAAEFGEVAAIGLGIALVSTVLPGAAVLRLRPRSLLTDSE